ncbi:uncharacterized protein BDR25DRAFT_355635 [Lindgomyces ingoldianus]|uniref:Uncharacterized protein n=1 Tax=Lindgomyces ingoldianus TaxID=673940 RepID=A0ACB6QU47_9PLEO|nr:uncharacterized protein BDR25DRAFT_355635 [Lindgomyces ingoldianus]KAF2470538.1 hypothetical protein BDR25DRAFT_355635 [Lindgomyces ingoldianus]
MRNCIVFEDAYDYDDDASDHGDDACDYGDDASDYSTNTPLAYCCLAMPPAAA